MQQENKKYKILANVITASRLLGGPLFFIIYLNYGGIATAIFAGLFYSTDFIDGYIARKYKVSSFFGSILDSCCDKIIGIVTFIVLGMINKLLYVPIYLEIAILLTNLFAYRRGNNIKSSLLGKVKTFALMSLGALIFLISETSLSFLISYCAIAIIILQISVLIDYLIKALRKPEIKLKLEKSKLKTMKEIKRDIFSTSFYFEHKDEGVRQLFYKT